MIKFYDISNQDKHLHNTFINIVKKHFKKSDFILGQSVRKFEINFANFTNSKFAVGCANGTDALQIAFMALDLKPGDEIICPSWTYIATAEAAAILGIKIVFCDVDLETFNITADDVKSDL